MGHDHHGSVHAYVRRTARVLAALFFVALGLTIASSSAQAGPPDLATVVLTDTLPGLVVNPPGATNGPINDSNVSVLGATASQVAAVKQQLANGNLFGYIRIWSSQVPQSRDAVVILALNITDTSQVGGFLADFNHGISSVASESFDTPDIAGGSGFTDHLPLSGQPATEYAVTFARGNTVFEVELATITGDLNVNDELSVASQQAAQAPGSVKSPVTPAATDSSPTTSTQNVSYVLGEVTFCLLVAILIVYLIKKTRRATPKTSIANGATSGDLRIPGSAWPIPIHASQATVQSPGPQVLGLGHTQGTQHSPSGLPLMATFAPATPPVTPPGWYPDPTDQSLQRYFDGTRWTDHTAPR